MGSDPSKILFLLPSISRGIKPVPILCGDWLFALPIASCGLKLETMRRWELQWDWSLSLTSVSHTNAAIIIIIIIQFWRSQCPRFILITTFRLHLSTFASTNILRRIFTQAWRQLDTFLVEGFLSEFLFDISALPPYFFSCFPPAASSPVLSSVRLDACSLIVFWCRRNVPAAVDVFRQ